MILIQKYEEMEQGIQAKNNIRNIKEFLSLSIQFLETVNKLKNSGEHVDLDQLAICRRLLENEEIKSIDTVRKEAVWVSTIYSAKVSKHRQLLESALESNSEIAVRK